jgi:uncharacterized protein YkwD
VPQAKVDAKRIQQMATKDYIKFSKEIFEALNKIRQNPASFIPTLERSMERFKHKVLMTADGLSGHETVEGAMAYIEGIEFIRQLKPVPALAWSLKLVQAARDHVNDIGPKGSTSGIGSGKEIG